MGWYGLDSSGSVQGPLAALTALNCDLNVKKKRHKQGI
jgi:hypothetical protein